MALELDGRRKVREEEEGGRGEIHGAFELLGI